MKKINWTPELISMLGTISDNKLAKIINCDTQAVRIKRRLLSIKSWFDTNYPPIDWTLCNRLLGTDTDMNISIKTGLSLRLLYNRRKELGIKAFKPTRLEDPIQWENFDKYLGKEPDRKLAKKIGCYYLTVRNRRKKLNIPAYRLYKINKLKQITDEYLLDTRHKVTAKKYKVSVATVCNELKKRGIRKNKYSILRYGGKDNRNKIIRYAIAGALLCQKTNEKHDGISTALGKIFNLSRERIRQLKNEVNKTGPKLLVLDHMADRNGVVAK
jgi:hypothetical protein